MIKHRIAQAATWLSDNWHVAPQPMTRTLRQMFGLSFLDACKAIAEARRIVGQTKAAARESRA